MVKMLNLVKNEYIKTMKKISTKIIFILVIIFAVGLVGIAKVAEKVNEGYMAEYGETASDPDYSYAINNAEEMKYDGYEYDVEHYNYLQKYNIHYTSWRYEAAELMFSYEIDENGVFSYTYPDDVRAEMESYISSNDWKSYCKSMIKTMKDAGMDEAGYWEYEYRLEHDIPLPNDYIELTQWQNEQIKIASGAKQFLADYDETAATSDQITEKANQENALTLALYRLENNIETNVADSSNILYSEEINYWSVFGTSTSLISVIGLLIIIITGSAVSNEFSNGTIKFLLINPVKRWKILVSKYIMSITLGYIMIFLLYVLSAVLTILFFGTSNLGADYLEVVDGAVKSTNGFAYILRNYMLSSVQVVVMATLAFAISSLVRSSSLAIGVSLFAMLSGNTLVMILKQALHQDWARYLIFANTDLEAVANGLTGFSHHSMLFAVSVIAVHMFVFLLTAWDGFTRREV